MSNGRCDKKPALVAVSAGFRRQMKRHRRTQPTSTRAGDPALAVATADAFRKLSGPFIERVAGRGWEARDIAAQDIPGMIASATALAFAVELYLKALCIITRRQPLPGGHNLWVLYRALHDDVRSS